MCYAKASQSGASYHDLYTIMILGSIIDIHFQETLSTFISKLQLLCFYSLDSLSVIKLKVLALLS